MNNASNKYPRLNDGYIIISPLGEKEFPEVSLSSNPRQPFLYLYLSPSLVRELSSLPIGRDIARLTDNGLKEKELSTVLASNVAEMLNVLSKYRDCGGSLASFACFFDDFVQEAFANKRNIYFDFRDLLA